MAKGRGKYSRNGGSSTYARATTENISILRLYAHDFGDVDFDHLTARQIYQMLGMSKDHYFRLVAVCLAPSKVLGTTDSVIYGPSSTTLEFFNGGTSYALSANATKPTRIRVPDKNLFVSQYWHYNSSNGSVAPTFNGANADQELYACGPDATVNGISNCVQFIDIAVRF